MALRLIEAVVPDAETVAARELCQGDAIHGVWTLAVTVSIAAGALLPIDLASPAIIAWTFLLLVLLVLVSVSPVASGGV